MKLLTRSMRHGELIALRDLLEANGIPAMIQSDDTGRMLTPLLTRGQSLWIYIDNQEDEARALLEDPEHVVANPVDVEAFYELTRDIRDDPSVMNRVMIHLGITVGLILILMLLVIPLIRWLAR
ncbi:MAG: hypothetical protein PVG47_01945 [Chromatiales bacterium]